MNANSNECSKCLLQGSLSWDNMIYFGKLWLLYILGWSKACYCFVLYFFSAINLHDRTDQFRNRGDISGLSIFEAEAIPVGFGVLKDYSM